ncbi:hypothetical protein B0F90DRAFT_1667445 [Multifurca ochricompacta]|uniref:VWFA domain-containing protein n=1 Tax=Multifurca ochricompacta TaxID=376703 RepID=A0AAD4QLT1_9AGAM|nr:hypothetical protein B0F90DRAFT_1667445 [Multifurca ochricompacta]
MSEEFYTPVPRFPRRTSVTDEPGQVGTLKPALASKDKPCLVKGMYPLLDLITEQGSSGLVDKIVIAQESLQAFINELSPGAYSSITKVNFKTLDGILLKPIGIYGSKEEIVRFLREIRAVDDNTYTFHFFHSRAIVWEDDCPGGDSGDEDVGDRGNHDDDDDYYESNDSDSDGSDRIFDYRVKKTKDQGENVVTRTGFTVRYFMTGVFLVFKSPVCHKIYSPLLGNQHPPPGVHVDPKVLLPTLLHGEKVQGFMTAEFKPAKTVVEPFFHDHQTADQVRLRCGANGDDVLCLSNTIDDMSLKTLMDLGFSTRFSKEYADWEQNMGAITQSFLNSIVKEQAEMHTKIDQGFESTRVKLKDAVTNKVLPFFPSLRREILFPEFINPTGQEVEAGKAKNPLHDLLRIYPKVTQMIQDGIYTARLDNGIGDSEFQFKKTRFYFLRDLLDSEDTKNLKTNEIEALVNTILESRDMQSTLSSLKNFGKDDKDGGVFHSLKTWMSKAFKRSEGGLWEEARDYASLVSDSDFLVRRSATGADDYLYNAAVDIEKTAYDCTSRQIEYLVSRISQQILSTQKEECDKQVQRASQSAKDKELEALRSNFVRQIEDLSRERSTSGRHELLPEEEIEYQVHLLHLHTDQRHNLQQDPSFVPTPVVNQRLSGSFHVPPGTLVKYAHLLEGDRILLGLVNSQGNVMIYIESLARIDNVIQLRSFAQLFHKDKIGEKCIFAFDESKRMLAFYASARMQLHIFVFDEEFKSLRGMGSAINLSLFYNPGASIIHACFVHGNEEILFVDSDAQARIFSLTMLQHKSASLQLPQVPRAIYSSPNGSCVLVVQEEDGVSSMRAYHWSTFGSTDGIPITPDNFSVDLGAALLTSIVNRNTIHLIGFDLKSRCCRSLILDITCKSTEFTFQEQGSKMSSNHGKETAHNCLIDCHADVWMRFPVVPAVKRRTITSQSKRQGRTLLFVSQDDRRPFASHFSDLIRNFERTSRKPTGDALKGITVSARTFPSFVRQFLSGKDWPVSRFRAGEWLADLLCLIPIHIAVTHENRFIPLKDGVFSAQLEASLLGAEVNRIVDSLSLGWYESIFQSYWASKPVKVVSSMGEQSVGKSFTLNHLVDTSFAGSAMRTTEGVWMSVSPTDDALIVALDFEGVHSLERSAQEDTLLVLFNTAISNLVLFRNNFALSRDITGLFQSFQSSSSILDPTTNPTLFQSVLVVIIKDVIDSDKNEVTREFSLKFQKIVADEQDSNFITRLHAGQLKIIPWPVIESREFYKLFGKVKRMLDDQPTSYFTAGEFLHTLKTLMAKLKANDWGAMSQTMAAHRSNALLAILPIALETGLSEITPEQVPLKNFDTDLVVDAEDTEAQFSLAGRNTSMADRELKLVALSELWNKEHPRQHIDDSKWSADLAQYLTHLVDLRVAHVDQWLESNTQRFQMGNASMAEYVECLTQLSLISEPASNSASHIINASMIAYSANGMEARQSFAEKLLAILGIIYAVWVLICVDSNANSLEDGVAKITYGARRWPRLLSSGPYVWSPLQLGQFDVAEWKIVHMLRDMSHLIAGYSSSCQTISDEGFSEIKYTQIMSVNYEIALPPVNYAAECVVADTFMAWNLTRIIFAEKNTLVPLYAPGGYAKFRQLPYPLRLRLPEGMVHSNTRSIHKTLTPSRWHPQPEHETSHGSMSKTKWAIDGPDGTSLELGGHKFSSNDEGGPMLCNMVCASMGRHVHIDYCRGDASHNSETLHLKEKIVPKPQIPKDWITHGLHWRRMGFKDPYPREDQANFAKCDALCPGPEHTVEEGGANAQPSRCTEALFHAPMDGANAPSGVGYVSSDGHHFACRNPILMQPAYHVIFVIDRSSSMWDDDKKPDPNAAGHNRIMPTRITDLGHFWLARQAATNRNAFFGVGRRDAYSLIFFNHESTICLENDFTSSPDELLTTALRYGPSGGTEYLSALDSTQKVMNSHWSTERAPIVIFLSDGEDFLEDDAMYDICRSAESSSSTLRRMTDIALEVQKNAPHDPLLPAAANILSSFTEALDTVRLTATFQGMGYAIKGSPKERERKEDSVRVGHLPNRVWDGTARVYKPT